MRVIRTAAELRAHLDPLRRADKVVGAVPTMGALHDGHLSLIQAGRARCDELVVTIFVNPTQFGPNEDFERYPRDLSRDVELCTQAEADVVFAPETKEMYPEGEQTRVRVRGLSDCLCGRSRPGHFDGVATVVCKLFHVVGPGVFCFGQKDFQQLQIVRRMATDLLFPVEIVACPIVREADGLAMSSRNRYLSRDERSRALFLSRALQEAIESYREGERDPRVLGQSATECLLNAGLSVDYVELCNASDLTPVEANIAEPALLALAAFAGNTRLIDNVVLQPDVEDVLRGAA